MAKRNMQAFKTDIPIQDASVRIHNFDEVALGYTEEMAVNEAKRCLDCKHKPCISGCPVRIKIPEFIQLVAESKFQDAYYKILETNALPAISGRVCPQESQCEMHCVRGKKGEAVAIGRLERFVADWYYKQEHSQSDNTEVITSTPNENARSENSDKQQLEKVAIIGSGPASLSCAADLANLGYRVSIFEAFHRPGGVLIYGIPEFRLPKAIVADQIDKLRQRGVTIETNVVVGRTMSVDNLFDEENFKAVFLGTGAGLPRFMGIPGEALIGVYSANEYLTRANLMKAYDTRYHTPIRTSKKLAVIGAGNVAMDAARTAVRLGAESVYVIYRRSFEEMPARKEEIEHAQEEGVIFKNLTNPVKIHGDENGQVKAIECIEMGLGEADESGRRRPVPIEDSNFILDLDTVIVAIGTSPNPLIASTTDGLDTSSRGTIITDELGQSSREGIFAGGDAVTGAATVILAMGAGKTAAGAIDTYLTEKRQGKQ